MKLHDCYFCCVKIFVAFSTAIAVTPGLFSRECKSFVHSPKLGVDRATNTSTFTFSQNLKLNSNFKSLRFIDNTTTAIQYHPSTMETPRRSSRIRKSAPKASSSRTCVTAPRAIRAPIAPLAKSKVDDSIVVQQYVLAGKSFPLFPLSIFLS